MRRRFFDVLDSGALHVGFSDCWRRNVRTGNIASAQRLVRGALPIVVTLLGWLALAKGLRFLFISPESPSRFWDSFHCELHFNVYASISFILGAYVTYTGFRRCDDNRVPPF